MFCELLPHSFLKVKDGVSLRYSKFLSRKQKGTLLIVPGAREFIEKKYMELGKDFVEKGFDVIIYEPRGQGLSSRFFEGEMRQKNHITDFSVHIEDLKEVYANIVKPHVEIHDSSVFLCHGHSLGGHILLKWLAENDTLATGAFLTSPMISMVAMAAHNMNYRMSLASVQMMGTETEYFPLNHDFGGDDLIFDNNPLTSDENRFRIIESFFQMHKNLVSGGVTYGWMLAALRSLNTLQNWAYLNNINIPVLALLGELDLVIPYAESLPFLNMLPNAEIEIIKNARHDILNEADSIKKEALDRIDKFIEINHFL